MNHSFYERLVIQNEPKKRRAKAVGLCLLYTAWFAVWNVVMLWIGINAPMLILIPLTTVLLIVLTWRLLHVEFEYSLLDGTLVIDRIVGKKKRKSLFEAELRQATLIAPLTDETMAQAQKKMPEQFISALSSPEDEDAWLLLFEDPSETRTLVLLNADDAMCRIFRRCNPRAVSHTAGRSV